ncbi:MAG: hypothetical protein JSV04_02065 [Candidatus Heimdallarchaeota archaeon]|nr:MAG: hypothetical protein JSV04_02065 [Candidatus Heimdallarchaeota archaeon]
MRNQITEFDYRITDVYEADNLIEGELQNLPSYLTIQFNVEAEYTIISSLGGDITGDINGNARPGLKLQWRIPILEQGDLKIEIRLHNKSGRLIQEVIPMCVPVELFESSLQTDEESSEEENYYAELNLPTKEEIKHVDVTSRLAELDAHWLQIDPELKIWRYIHQDTESRLKEGRFVPVLLVHGFNSDYSTWNWLVRYLWSDLGFRNIFGVALYDDRLGVEKNAVHMDKVIDEVLGISNHESLIFLGHSLGGLIGRYFVKKMNPKKIKLLITLGSPHICGLSKLWGKLFILIKNAQVTERDVTLHPQSSLVTAQKIFTEADFYQQTMVNICGTKIRGGDGGFKFKNNIVPDMINLPVNYTHLTLNKNEDTYNIIKKMVLGYSVIYKIRLLYVTSTIETPLKSKLHLLFKAKTEVNSQRYPIKDHIQLEEKEPYVPIVPLIVFTYLRNQAKTEQLEVKVCDEKHKILAHEKILFALGDKNQICDHFSLTTENGYTFQFAVYSYRLYYGSNND